jgi:hypothetical protein
MEEKNQFVDLKFAFQQSIESIKEKIQLKTIWFKVIVLERIADRNEHYWISLEALKLVLSFRKSCCKNCC